MGSAPVGVQSHLISSLGEFSCCKDRLWYPVLSPVFGVHHLSLHLSISCFYILHLPLNFIRVSSLRLMYLHPSVDPSSIHFLGAFPGLGLALVPDVVVPEADQGCAWSRNLISNLNVGPCSLMATNVTTWPQCTTVHSVVWYIEFQYFWVISNNSQWPVIKYKLIF